MLRQPRPLSTAVPQGFRFPPAVILHSGLLSSREDVEVVSSQMHLSILISHNSFKRRIADLFFYLLKAYEEACVQLL